MSSPNKRSSMSSEDDDDDYDDQQQQEEKQQEEEEQLSTLMAMRIHAANLPRFGLLKTLPDTYAVVTSVSGRASKSGPAASSKGAPQQQQQQQQNNNVQDHVVSTVEWGRTEVIHRNTNPQWTQSFPLEYHYGEECYFYIQIYRQQQQDKNNNKKDPVSLGTAVCEIGDILGSKNHTKVKRLPNGGVVFCRLEPLNRQLQHQVARLQFRMMMDPNQVKVIKMDPLHFLLGGEKKLKKQHPPDTIIQISKKHPHATRLSWIIVYRSSPVKESWNPTWDLAQIDLESLCNGNIDRPLRLSVVAVTSSDNNNNDHNNKARRPDMVIGECETTLAMMLHTQRDHNATTEEAESTKHGFRLQRSLATSTNPKKNVKNQKMVGRLKVALAQIIDVEKEVIVEDLSSYHDSFKIHNDYMMNNKRQVSTTSIGVRSSSQDLSLANSDLTEDPYITDITALPAPMQAPATFQDYIRDGVLLDFCVAIDFTSSNGDPRVPGTLHHQSSAIVNDYEETIQSIGNAVAAYSDQFSVWGFGAKFGDGVLRHLFQCGPDAQVHGVDGVLQAYRSMFASDITMSGPTLFDQVIQAAAAKAHKHQQVTNNIRYFVLLIITDGISQELEETKRKLSVYSKVPLSVIFVGVGRADFHSMYELCEPSVGSGGGERPIATFVEFRQHQHDPRSLGREALKNMPNQLVQYMLQNGFRPSK